MRTPPPTVTALFLLRTSDPVRAACAACDKHIRPGALVFDGVYVDPNGRMHPHHLCFRCGRRANRSAKFHEQIANRIELMFMPAGGHA